MKKGFIVASAAFAVLALSGCGNNDTAVQDETQKQMQQMQKDLDAQQAEVDQVKDDMVQKTEDVKEVGCAQQLELKNTQLALLKAHVESLQNLENKVESTPDFAIETCRNLNPGLSVPECEVKVDNFMNGKSDEMTETQSQITQIESDIVDLETNCVSDVESIIDANGNIVTPGCKSWFDGCNTCTITEPGMPMACTMKACDEAMMQPAQCMD